MSLRVTQDCINCGSCIWECPAEAIDPGEAHPRIEAKHCAECFGFFAEQQCIVVCPVPTAIEREDETEAELRSKFIRNNGGATPQHTSIWTRLQLPKAVPRPEPGAD
jgi:Fe-S-cluster-containing hydrogenase component 2